MTPLLPSTRLSISTYYIFPRLPYAFLVDRTCSLFYPCISHLILLLSTFNSTSLHYHAENLLPQMPTLVLCPFLFTCCPPVTNPPLINQCEVTNPSLASHLCTVSNPRWATHRCTVSNPRSITRQCKVANPSLAVLPRTVPNRRWGNHRCSVSNPRSVTRQRKVTNPSLAVLPCTYPIDAGEPIDARYPTHAR